MPALGDDENRLAPALRQPAAEPHLALPLTVLVGAIERYAAVGIDAVEQAKSFALAAAPQRRRPQHETRRELEPLQSGDLSDA
jgi:hypothetical protein